MSKFLRQMIRFFNKVKQFTTFFSEHSQQIVINTHSHAKSTQNNCDSHYNTNDESFIVF